MMLCVVKKISESVWEVFLYRDFSIREDAKDHDESSQLGSG